MMMTIAVLLNEKGFAATVGDARSVKVFLYKDDNWSAGQESEICISRAAGIVEVRSAITDIVQKLEGCNLFVAKEVSGQLYYILEAHGFQSYEAEGKPEEFLNSIKAAEESAAIEKEETAKECQKSLTPIKVDEEGAFSIDLKNALLLEPSLSSKKILIPFLNQAKFAKLEVICDHVPRWIPMELEKLHMKYEVIKLKENEMKIIVNPN